MGEPLLSTYLSTPSPGSFLPESRIPGLGLLSLPKTDTVIFRWFRSIEEPLRTLGYLQLQKDCIVRFVFNESLEI